MPPWARPQGFAPPGFGPPPFGFQRPRRPVFRFLVAAILFVLLLDLIGANLAFFAAVGAAATTKVKEVTLIDGDTSTIAAIPVTGLIDDDTAHQFDQFLSAAESDKTVKAIVLEIDTPGGSASASDTMYHRLQVFKDNMKSAGRTVPVIVSMGGMATSGGYYVACGGDYLFAQPATMTANIGVLMPRFNISELLDKYGVKETTIVGTGGEFKNLGSMFQPENEKAQQYLQGLVDATLAQFKKVVTDGRRGHLPADTSAIFNGRVYMADDALKLGLIDKIGYHEEAYAYAKSAANSPGARVVRYSPPSALERLLSTDSLSQIPAGKATSGSNVTINGVNIDIRQLADLLAPRPMYLWQGN
jgi:protease-4